MSTRVVWQIQTRDNLGVSYHNTGEGESGWDFVPGLPGGEEMDGAHGIGTGLMPYSGGNRPAEGPTMNISSDMLTRPARGR